MTTRRQLPPLEHLQERLEYDPCSGKLIWKNGQRAGHVAGTITSSGYVQIMMCGYGHRAHRLIWLLHYGKAPRGDIDHINGDRSDNRISNLRDVAHGENLKNSRLPKHNTSGHVGVMKWRGGWRAQVSVNGKIIHLGCYKSKEDAVAARSRADKLFGFHPNHGRIQRGY